ncbi:CHAT domain protein [Rhizoctonia solani]|uniref:CHAT domain protein n=1 Tax=Rhizoctonia solani TaxID=456999 RepID=A0A8H8STE4_9AGAM|nr:CHAT domain protein [Rhizoctonia solani]QRW17469.1 CHAT domain protein [Rhizoctonia solani]
MNNIESSHDANGVPFQSSTPQEILQASGEIDSRLVSERETTALQGTRQLPETEDKEILDAWIKSLVEQLKTLGTKISQKKLDAAELDAKSILQQLGPTKTLPSADKRRQKGLEVLESLSNVILSNIVNFSRNQHYLDIACHVIDESLPFLPPDHPAPADWLFNLAKCYQLRYELAEGPMDIQNAITCLENVVRLTPLGHPKQLFRIESLGEAHRQRWDRTKDSNDLTKALEYYSTASSLEPQDSAAIPSLYAKMAGLFSAWSQADRHYELEGLGRAVELQKYAISLVAEGDARLPTYLRTLGRYYHHRFKRSGNKDDAESAIESQTKAMGLSPEGSMDKLNIMSDLGSSYQARFAYLGNLEDCNSAVRLHEETVSATSDGDPNIVVFLSSLGTSYLERFAYLGIKDDLSKSMDILSRAVSLTPAGDKDLPGRLNNLGLAYNSRFQYFGKLPDIDKAIELQGSAMQLSANGHQQYLSTIYGNLGNSFHSRFSRLKRVSDIESAIFVQTQAVKNTPDEHPTMPGLLDSLGSAYESRFRFRPSRRKMDDLNRAIEYKTRAVNLTPAGNSKLATYLNNLGLAYGARFSQLGQEEDGNKAIDHLNRAVELTRDDHSDKQNWLNNLGNSYRERFRVRKELQDFELAIATLSRAISLTDEGHSNMPMMLSNMALSYLYRFEQSGDQEALDKSITLFQRSSRSSYGHPINKFNSTRILAYLLLSNSRPGFVEAYQSAVNYLPQVVWLGDIASTKLYQVQQLSDFIEEAAAAAMEAQEISLALEWLEQGRSIVWGQHLQLQTPLDELSSINSELAGHLKEAADELYSSASGIFSSPISDASLYLKPMSWNVQQQHQMADRYERLLDEARRIPGFERFLRPKQVSELFQAARYGPVVVVNAHKSRCDALILLPKKNDLIHVPLPNLYRNKILDFNLPPEILAKSSDDTAEFEGLRGVRLKAGKDQFESTLCELWLCVVKPVLEALGYPNDRPPDEPIHMTWNTTGPLSLLPLHAAGDYSRPLTRLYNFAFSSYIPTLSVLLRSNPSPHAHSRIMAVGQEATPGQAPLPCTKQELEFIQIHAKDSIHYTQLTGSEATAQAVISEMEDSDWIHFACHAYQQPFAPLDSSFKLHESDLRLRQIMQKHFRNKGLAFLSACQTASGDKNLPNESSHLAAGMLIAGYPCVIATMWAIVDSDAPLVADHVYSQLIKGGKLNYEGSARALHDAVAVLREKVGEKSFTRWAPFIHVGS